MDEWMHSPAVAHVSFIRRRQSGERESSYFTSHGVRILAQTLLLLLYRLFASSTSGIVFNPSAGANTDHGKSANDTDPYF